MYSIGLRLQRPPKEAEMTLEEWLDSPDFRCFLCANRRITFSSKEAINNHLLNWHQKSFSDDKLEKMRVDFFCPLCGKEMAKTKRSFGHHLAMKHKPLTLNDYFNLRNVETTELEFKRKSANGRKSPFKEWLESGDRHKCQLCGEMILCNESEIRVHLKSHEFASAEVYYEDYVVEMDGAQLNRDLEQFERKSNQPKMVKNNNDNNNVAVNGNQNGNVESVPAVTRNGAFDELQMWIKARERIKCDLCDEIAVLDAEESVLREHFSSHKTTLEKYFSFVKAKLGDKIFEKEDEEDDDDEPPEEFVKWLGNNDIITCAYCQEEVSSETSQIKLHMDREHHMTPLEYYVSIREEERILKRNASKMIKAKHPKGIIRGIRDEFNQPVIHLKDLKRDPRYQHHFDVLNGKEAVVDDVDDDIGEPKRKRRKNSKYDGFEIETLRDVDNGNADESLIELNGVEEKPEEVFIDTKLQKLEESPEDFLSRLKAYHSIPCLLCTKVLKRNAIHFHFAQIHNTTFEAYYNFYLKKPKLDERIRAWVCGSRKQCLACEESYTQEDIMRKHVQFSHGVCVGIESFWSLNPDKIECQLCDLRMGRDRFRIADHIHFKHNTTILHYFLKYVEGSSSSSSTPSWRRVDLTKIDWYNGCKYGCNNCSQIFTNQHGLISHVRRVHPDKQQISSRECEKLRIETCEMRCLMCDRKVIHDKQDISDHLYKYHKLHIEDYQRKFVEDY